MEFLKKIFNATECEGLHSFRLFIFFDTLCHVYKEDRRNSFLNKNIGNVQEMYAKEINPI